MSGTIKTGTLKLNGVDTNYFFPDPVGAVSEASDVQLDGVPITYFKAPALGSIMESELLLNGVASKYYRPNTTGFGAAGSTELIDFLTADFLDADFK